MVALLPFRQSPSLVDESSAEINTAVVTGTFTVAERRNPRGASKRLALNGSNATILTGYGAMGIHWSRTFDPRGLGLVGNWGGITRLPTYAVVANSAETGKPRRFFRPRKPNTWRDVIACAEYSLCP